MVVKKEYCDVNVSNPWREAIEEFLSGTRKV